MEKVRHLVESTGMFYPFEVDVAVQLVEERLAKGVSSGYFFLFAESGEKLIGYACYGPIACTQGSYDLYWIVVDKNHQRCGVGRALLRRAEREIARRGGRRVYIETSGRDQYAPTRAFYQRCGYAPEAVLADFYAPGDDKLIYVKQLPGAETLAK
jgi:GNAT superfamily N-acetyltransferase